MGARLSDDSRILVVKLADVGDTLLATPALRLLRDSYPRAHIAALTAPHSVAVLHGSALVDEIITFDQHRFDRVSAILRPRALLAAASELLALRGARFDALLLFHHLITTWGVAKYAALCLASGAKRRVGLDDGRGWFLTDRVLDPGFGHQPEAEYCLSIVRKAGAEGRAGGLELPVERPDRDFAEAALRAIPRPWVAIHPGSGGFSLARRWPADGFAMVADVLAREIGAGIVLVGGKEETALAAEVRALMSASPLDLTGRTTLGQLAAVLGRCDLLIGNDSGVAHVGAAAGTRVVAVFGPSNHLAWGPYEPGASPCAARHRIVRVNLPCSPCMYRNHSLGLRYGCATRDCLRLVTPEMVLAQAGQLLDMWPPSVSRRLDRR